MSSPDPALRRVVHRVALLNFGYFWIEVVVATAIGSVALFADSIDFLEDTVINVLIFAALGWSAARRTQVGMALAGVILIPGLAALWTAWEKLAMPVAPDPTARPLAGTGAFAVNLACALMLLRHRSGTGSLPRAAFLSARNDVFANLAIVAAEPMTALLWTSAWPDLITGLAIALVNADAAREVWEAARLDHREAAP